MTTGAGKYRTRIAVQRKKTSATVNAAGHIDETSADNWETFTTVWASLKYGTGRESLTGDQMTASDQATVMVRSSEVSRSFAKDMRFKVGSRVFSISQPPVDVDDAKKEVRFTAVEVR